MGVDSRVGRGVGRDRGRGVGRVRKSVSSLPLPYIGSKWSKIDFDSYFEHKIASPLQVC